MIYDSFSSGKFIPKMKVVRLRGTKMNTTTVTTSVRTRCFPGINILYLDFDTPIFTISTSVNVYSLLSFKPSYLV